MKARSQECVLCLIITCSDIKEPNGFLLKVYTCKIILSI